MEEESINMAGIVKCEMRIALFHSFFQFLHGSIGIKEKIGLRIQPREQSGTKKVKFHLLGMI